VHTFTSAILYYGVKLLDARNVVTVTLSVVTQLNVVSGTEGNYDEYSTRYGYYLCSIVHCSEVTVLAVHGMTYWPSSFGGCFVA
jgi:hypothetical protein